ncbi:hypothetical protein vseg_009420 [Gypsophila vaccaria]
MKHFSYIMSLVLLFAMTFTLANGVSLVPETCKNITTVAEWVDYDFCVKTLESDPQSSTANLDELAAIAFNVVVSRTQSIANKVAELLKDPKFDVFQINALKDCQELYDPEEVKVGLKSFKNKDFGDANRVLSSAITCAETCEEGFQEREKFSPLTKDNSDYELLTSVPFGFIVLFKSFHSL